MFHSISKPITIMEVFKKMYNCIQSQMYFYVRKIGNIVGNIIELYISSTWNKISLNLLLGIWLQPEFSERRFSVVHFIVTSYSENRNLQQEFFFNTVRS